MIKQYEIIEKLKVKSTINVEQEIELRKQLIKTALFERGFKKLVLGISGGQDSTLAAKLCQDAIDELKKESNDLTYEFIAMRLPYGVQSDEEDCQKAIDFVKPDRVINYNIKASVDVHISEFSKLGIKINDHHKGNIKARERMVAQYLVAGVYDAIVVGTDHAAEAITGFFTKWGDQGADVIPLYGLNKRQGKMLAISLKVPKILYLKTPTADLEDSRPGLADEDALGVSYQAIDDYLEGKIIAKSDQDIIEKWYAKTIHKRENPRNLYEQF